MRYYVCLLMAALVSLPLLSSPVTAQDGKLTVEIGIRGDIEYLAGSVETLPSAVRELALESVDEFGINPPVASVLIERAKLSIRLISPNKYNKIATMVMYTAKITVIVRNNSFICKVLPEMNPRIA